MDENAATKLHLVNNAGRGSLKIIGANEVPDLLFVNEVSKYCLLRKTVVQKANNVTVMTAIGDGNVYYIREEIIRPGG